jgi:hypothetical protein
MINDTLHHLQHAAAGVIQAANSVLYRREGVLYLPYGHKYNGRTGVVDGLMLAPDGKILCCFYVYRQGTRVVLNGDADSRSYRPLGQISLSETIRTGSLDVEPPRGE